MKIHLITNCTNLKKQNILGKLKLADFIQNNSSNNTIYDWCEQLESAEQKIPADELYAGDHWKVACSIKKTNLELWVLSAGYGLIHSSSKIGSYDATFSNGTDNSINKTGLSNTQWWDGLHQLRDSDAYKCSSLHSLVSNNQEDIFFIVASPDYLKVIQSELKKLVLENKLTKNNLFLISSKFNVDKVLKPYYLESSADFSNTLKGGRVSLNIRLAKYLLETDGTNTFNHKGIIRKYTDLRSTSPKLPVKNRQKISDNEVIAFIKHEFLAEHEAKVSMTLLLQRLRNKNLACEHKRFSKLFKLCK